MLKIWGLKCMIKCMENTNNPKEQRNLIEGQKTKERMSAQVCMDSE